MRTDKYDGYGGIISCIRNYLKRKSSENICQAHIVTLDNSNINFVNIYIHPNARISEISSKMISLANQIEKIIQVV